MAFDSLTEKLQNVFKNLRSKGRLTEDDVKEALKEIKRALLAADVNFKVVKDFIKSVQERAIGQDVMNGLNPGQMVIKIVNEELINLMGSETTEIQLQPGKAITLFLIRFISLRKISHIFFIRLFPPLFPVSDLLLSFLWQQAVLTSYRVYILHRSDTVQARSAIRSITPEIPVWIPG